MTDESDIVSIRRKAMDLLARREHSALELRRKLLSREFDEATVDEVLARLQHDRLQSDERFTESYVHHRVNAGVGPLKIRQELLQRGIGDDLAQQYLDSMSDQWDEMMAQQRVRKFGETIPQDLKDRMKQARFLQNRGFSPDSVMRLFR
jgi:regulatory protein